VLLVVSKRIGDTIFCTPALHWLRASWPRLRIDVIAPSRASADVLRHNPAIDRLWERPGPWTRRRLARLSWDLALDLHGAKETRRATRGFAAPVAVCEVHGNAQSTVHQSELVAAFVREILPVARDAGEETSFEYEIFPQPSHDAAVDRLLQRHGADGAALVGFHTGSYPIAARGRRLFRRPLVAEARNWPFERFVELGERLAASHPGLRVVLTGSSGEKEIARRYFRGRPWAIDLIGSTEVLELAALMRRLRCFVTGDTGPLHVACAMGTPVVALSGPPQVPVRTGPHPPRADRVLLHEEPGLAHLEVPRVLDAVSRCMSPKRQAPALSAPG